ncbi:MAG: hypothetical protein WCO54_08800 [Bacteroidota bacterium]
MAKANSGQVKEYIKIGAYLGIAYLGYKAIKNIAETFGLIKTKAEEQIDTGTTSAGESTIEAQSNNPYLSFSPQYALALIKAFNKTYPKKKWDNKMQMKFDTSTYKGYGVKPDGYADRIYRAKGIFKDDENSVLDVFRNLQTQFQISQLARFFSFYYKQDMLSYLKTFMDDNNLKEVLDIIKNYPQFYK